MSGVLRVYAQLNNMHKLDIYGYEEANIVVMLDGGMVDNLELVPTRANIVSGTLWQVDEVTWKVVQM